MRWFGGKKNAAEPAAGGKEYSSLLGKVEDKRKIQEISARALIGEIVQNLNLSESKNPAFVDTILKLVEDDIEAVVEDHMSRPGSRLTEKEARQAILSDESVIKQIVQERVDEYRSDVPMDVPDWMKKMEDRSNRFQQ